MIREVYPGAYADPTIVILHYLMGFLANMIEDKPVLQPLLRAQFPRPRTLRAMLGRAYTVTECEDGQPSIVSVITPQIAAEFMSQDPDSEVHASDDMHTQAMWRVFEKIRIICADEKECRRRGCKRKGTKRCTECTEELRYCGAECQKRRVRRIQESISSTDSSVDRPWDHLSSCTIVRTL